jgi:signal transduction histidine kinase/CheY-like chemotaxis protein
MVKNKMHDATEYASRGSFQDMQNNVSDAATPDYNRKSNLTYRLVSGFIIINLFVIFLIGLSLYNSRLQYYKLAEILTQNMAKSLETTICGIFDKIDIGLSAVARETERQMATHGGIKKKELNAYAKRQLEELPELDRMLVTDAVGNLLYGTEIPVGKPTNIGDREYLHRLRDNEREGLALSKVVLGRISGKWTIILARRVSYPDGSFAGVVTGTFQVSYFDKLFSQLDIGKRGAIGIRDMELSLVALHPKGKEPGSQIGSKVVSQKTRDMIQANPDTGTYNTVFARDNMERTVTFRKVVRYPFYIFATSAPIDYLAPWKREAIVALTLFVIFTLATFISLRMFLKSRAAELSRSEAVRKSVELSDDIDKYEVIQIQLQQAKAAAESANTAKSQFLANMSHEIRTPMNGVLGMTQLLELTELTEEQRQYVVALKLSGKNLMSLISDILDLSKIEAGKITVELSEFSLKQCINDVVMMQKFVSHEKGLKLHVNLSVDIPYLLVGDQLRIKQILLNLMGNAVKFTAEGSITVSAHLLEQHETSVLIEIAIRDTGIGIGPEFVDDIFKPFTQEDGSISRRYGGTGLGLTISSKLAELMGGTITVESTLGVGSCFSVTLPFIIGTSVIIPPAAPAPTSSDWDGPPLRVLLVEDDQVTITFGTSLLKKLGHTVTTAENGRLCLAALQNGAFDIVLMDVQMPVMNGEEALLEIRAKEKGTATHLPVIALTAHSMRGDRERLLEVGFDGYVSKPLSIKDLVVEMKRVVENYSD